MLKLSIIIPVYNVERYISQCLDSVISQDLPLSEYEIICVNDDSPDNSRDIVLEYMKRFPNIQLIEHEHNKKLGAARNTGRLIAQGKYIWNVDSDDMIAPNCLGTIIRKCETEKPDILMMNHYQLYPDKTVENEFPFNKIEACDGITFMKKYGIASINHISVVWSQIYRKDFLDKNNIYSPPINIGEDVPYSFKSILLADKICSVSSPFYYYRINEKSLGGALENSPKAYPLYEKSFICPFYMREVLSIIPSSETTIYHSIEQVLKYIINWYLEYLPNMDFQEKRKLSKLCRRNFHRNIWEMSFMSKRNQLKYLRLLFSGK